MQKLLSVLIVSFLFIASCNKSPAFTPTKPVPPGEDSIKESRKYADVIRNRGDDFFVDPKLTAVTHDFGYTHIKLGDLPIRTELAVASPKPWSSWWFPKREKTLFDDSNRSQLSTLTKYDLLRRKRNPSAGSAAQFEQKSFNTSALAWEGLCDAWSLAAIAMPEPKHSVSFSEGGVFSRLNVEFSVSDIKALLLKTFEATDDASLTYYGEKFTGSVDGWIYPDLFPEQFHRFVEVQIFEKHQPFIMDHDAGVQVWNVPVYKANFSIAAVPNKPDAVFVRAWIYSAESSERNEMNFVGTKEIIREYDYVLEGTVNQQNELVVDSGYWVTGPDGINSRNDHPDYVIEIQDPTHLTRKSWNPEIDIKLVDEIYQKSL